MALPKNNVVDILVSQILDVTCCAKTTLTYYMLCAKKKVMDEH